MRTINSAIHTDLPVSVESWMISYYRGTKGSLHPYKKTNTIKKNPIQLEDSALSRSQRGSATASALRATSRSWSFGSGRSGEAQLRECAKWLECANAKLSVPNSKSDRTMQWTQNHGCRVSVCKRKIESETLPQLHAQHELAIAILMMDTKNLTLEEVNRSCATIHTLRNILLDTYYQNSHIFTYKAQPENVLCSVYAHVFHSFTILGG